MRATTLASRACCGPSCHPAQRGCIRAVHRRQFEEDETLLHQAGESARSAQDALAGHPEIYHVGGCDERTRGDPTLVAVQQALETRIERLQACLDGADRSVPPPAAPG